MEKNYNLSKLKILRTKAGLTQQQLADKLNINRSSISTCETKPSVAPLDVLLKLIDYFKISMEDILEQNEEKNIISEQKATYADKNIHHHFDIIRKSLDKIRDHLTKVEYENDILKEKTTKGNEL